jgi:hypothetical protein
MTDAAEYIDDFEIDVTQHYVSGASGSEIVFDYDDYDIYPSWEV